LFKHQKGTVIKMKMGDNQTYQKKRRGLLRLGKILMIILISKRATVYHN